jgi:hypothetical protein
MKWFKHDTDASTDARIKKLILRYGAEGYAIYFHCLELIAGDISETNVTFELEHDAEIIADNLKIKGDSQKSGIDRVNEVMKYIISLELFTNDNGHIRCYKIAKRIDSSMTSNSKLRHLINDAKNHDAVMTKPCEIMEDHARLDKNRQDKTIYTQEPDDFISTLEQADAGRIATADAVACIPKPSVPKKKKEPTKTLEEHEIFDHIWQWTIKDHGLELGPKSGREAKACWQLVDLARSQFGLDAIAGVSSIITSLLTKKRQDRSQGGFWRDKSPLPSVVLANWHTLLETLREKTISPGMKEAIDEMFS